MADNSTSATRLPWHRNLIRWFAADHAEQPPPENPGAVDWARIVPFIAACTWRVSP